MEALGRQVLAEFYGCEGKLMNDVEFIRTHMLAAAEKAGATIVTQAFHHFSPHGVSGTVVIAESHLAIHTWPEYGYAAVDLFTCGESVNPWIAFQYLKDAFNSKTFSSMELRRGLFPGAVKHK